MPDIIDFLEQIGQSSRLRHAPKAVLEQALHEAQINPQLGAALLRRDRAEVEAILGVNNVCCLVNAPTPEGEEKESHDTKRQKAA